MSDSTLASRSAANVYILGLSGRWQSGKDTVARMFVQQLQQSGRFRHVYTRAFAGPLKRILCYLRPTLKLSDMEDEKGKNSRLPCRPEGLHIQVGPLIDAATGEWRERTLAEEQTTNMTSSTGDTLNLLQEYCGIPTAPLLTQRIMDAVHYFESLVDNGTIQTVGQALQQLGTNCFRNLVADNIWIAFQHVMVTLQYQRATMLEVEDAGTVLPKTDNGSAKNDVVVYTDVRFPNEYDYVLSNGGIAVRILRNVDYSKSTRDPNHPSETALDQHAFPHYIDNRGTLENTAGQVSDYARTLFVQG